MKKFNIKILLFFLLIIVSAKGYTQKQAANWYFGSTAGLDFNSGIPVAITDGALQTMEGCSSISRPNGSLRFYTDGSNVWDRHNNVMPNGSGLKGSPSSTQSALIVPKPESNNLFYIFTVDDIGLNQGYDGLQYSLVDMALNGFLGDVVASEKNILLKNNLCEKVTAVGHANGTDIWVISHEWGTNNFYSYLVTANGVNATPIISSVGIVTEGDPENSKGYMKLSPDGKRLAKANSCLDNSGASLEIFDFDYNTGYIKASNYIVDNSVVGHPYGVEFSSDGKVLYLNTWDDSFDGDFPKRLYQYDLNAGSPQAVIDSRLLIASETDGALQLGIDNKIYVAQFVKKYLSVINEPEKLGLDCSFSSLSISLDNKTSEWGLPPFIQSFFNTKPDFYFKNTCFGDSTIFYQTCLYDPDSLLWNFGDEASGSDNTSNSFITKHLFTSNSFFKVKMTVWNGGIKDSVSHMVFISSKPTVDLGNDTTFCSGNLLTLNAGSDAEKYLWHNGSTDSTFLADTSGQYWVIATNNTCIVYDTINVTVLPSYFRQIDTAFCAGDSIFADGDYKKTTGNYYDSLFNYIGCDSVIRTSLIVHDTFFTEQHIGRCNGDSAYVGGSWQKESGIYYDHYQTAWGCDSTIKTELNISDVIQTQTETDICQGDSVLAEGSYQKTTGIYIDSTQSSGGCDSVHTLQLFVNDIYDISWDTLICEGDSIEAGGNYQTTPGTYFDYLITIKGCDSTVQTNLSVTLLPVVDLGNDTSIMDGQTLTLNASGTPNATYLWQDGSTGSIYVVSDSGTYSVTVSNLCGYKEDSIKVTIYFPPEDLECFAVAPNAFTPNGDGLNDIFRPVLQCPAETYSLKIFSRWGKMIFETTNPAEGWDGTVNGKPVEHGTYVWTIYYKYTGVLHPGERTVKGTVNLIK